MKVVIIGNGIISYTTAYALLRRDSNVKITIVGPSDQKGCASLAAAAMFNSFCEVDPSTLTNEFEKKKFLFNRSAVPYWPEYLARLTKESDQDIPHGFGTYLINNHATDEMEDLSFNAVVSALKEFNEPYEGVDLKNIKNYKPIPSKRAARAIYIPAEGWVNPIALINSLKIILERSGRVHFENDYVKSLYRSGDRIVRVELEDGSKISDGDFYLMASGATFSKIISSSNLDTSFPKIFYGVGCSLLVKTGENTLTNCVRTPNRGLACGIYSAPQDSDHTLIGASNFISPWPEDHGRLTSIHNLVESAMEQINSDYYRAQLVKVNVGWRPTSEDTLPLIGKTSIENLLVATGTKRDGLHCSPVISEYLADTILLGKSSHDVSFFKPERTPYRPYKREEAIETAVKHILNAAYQHGFESAKNRMVEDLEKYYRDDITKLHDKVGAKDWGIPPEMLNMFRYGHTS